MKLSDSSYGDPSLDSTLSQFNLMYTHTQNFSDFTIITIASHTHKFYHATSISILVRRVDCPLQWWAKKPVFTKTCSVATVRTGHVSETFGRSLGSLRARDQLIDFFFLQNLSFEVSTYVHFQILWKSHIRSLDHSSFWRNRPFMKN